MKRHFVTMIAVAAALTAPAVAGAFTAGWSVEPAYTSMEQLAPGAYKVKRGMYTGIIDGNGKQIIKMTTDSITPFTEGKALVLTPVGNDAYRLQAILNSDLTQNPVYEEVYVEEYPFFSDGLIPVRNKQGFYGYMDEGGRMVLKPSYINIHPFHEGMAAVTKRPSNVVLQFISKGTDKLMEKFKQKTTVTYINRGGVEFKPQKSIGKLANASTFNQGHALVENKDGEMYIINNQGTVLSRYGGQNPEFDDRYILIDENYDNDDDVAAVAGEDMEIQTDKSVKIFKEGNKYGYTSNGDVLLPAQFDDADLFADGYAMAKLNGKWGLLKLEQGTFALAAKGGKATSSRKGKGKGRATSSSPSGFTVTTPAGFEKADLTLQLVPDQGGEAKTATVGGNGTTQRVFSVTPPSGKYTMKLCAGDLVLWEGRSGDSHTVSTSAAATANASTRLRLALSPASAKADIKDNCMVTLKITNPGDQAVTTTVKINGKGLTPVSRNITIPAGQSRRISTSFTKVYEREIRTVTATAGGFSTSRNITLSPFYVKQM